ncbi:MAG: hypothetical protein WD991_02550 [Candidatus Paceibacterota bacterium]
MNKTVSIILILGLAITIGVFVLGGNETASEQSVEIRDGIQYVNVEARGGYTPRVSLAQAGVPTKLVMTTTGTFDCSAALVIKAVNYQNILPQKGKTEIDLGVRASGETIDGLCSMGMYSFQIKFN